MAMRNEESDRLVIPHWMLNERLRATIDQISYQRVGRLAGLLLYPTVGAIGHLSENPKLAEIIYYTPFCVGVHQAGVLFGHSALAEIIQKGVIANPVYEHDKEYQLAELQKRFTHVYVRLNRDLVFVNEPRRGLFKRLFGPKRVSIASVPPSDPKIFSLLREMVSDNTKLNKIPYHHLDPEIRKQIDVVISARRKRFRRVMGGALVASALAFLSPVVSRKWITPFAGAAIGFIPSFQEPTRETKKLWELIGAKESIISPEFRDRHTTGFGATPRRNYRVTFFGNLARPKMEILKTVMGRMFRKKPSRR